MRYVKVLLIGLIPTCISSMQRTTLVAVTLTLLVGLALWLQHHPGVAKAAPLYSTFTVSNTSDSGVGSLRQAIADANSAPGTDTITFDAAVFDTPKAITLTSGELAISDSVTITGPGVNVLTISGNISSRVFAIGSGNYDVTLFGLTVIGGRHTGPGGGGGILNSSSGTLTLASIALSGNSANGSSGSHRGGGIFNAGNGAVALINSTLSDNSAYSLAGVDVTFGQGGGIFNAGNGTVTLTNSILSGNSATVFGIGFGFGEGGGIFNAGNGTVTLTNTTLSGNFAMSSLLPGSGGGIFNASTGTDSLINTTLSDNAATGSQGLGGGIANAAGTVTLTNSTLSGNSGTGGGSGKGGGAYNAGNGTVTLSNSTVTRNSVSGSIQSEGGGIFSEGTGTVNSRNSLIASNSSTMLAPDVRGTFNSQGHNLVGDGTGGLGFTGTGDQVGTTGSPIDAMLAPLADNGGPTQTHALSPGSLAINTGDNCVAQSPGCLTTPLTTDQRGAGFARSGGGRVDIGAFEVPSEYEGDVAPRPSGNRVLSLADWVQGGRFAVGLDVPSSPSEFQRADCAPRDTLGNGVISLSDWVQAGRYGAGLDPITVTGGPAGPAGLTSSTDTIALSTGDPEVGRTRRGTAILVASPISRRGLAHVVLSIDASGVENAINFALTFDPDRWEFVGAQAGWHALSGTLLVGQSEVAPGRVSIALALPPGLAVSSGWCQLVEMKFRLVGKSSERSPLVKLVEDGSVVDVFAGEMSFEWQLSDAREPRAHPHHPRR